MSWKAARLEAASLSSDIFPDICVSSSASASDAQTRWQGCHSDRRRQGNRLWGSPPHGQAGDACYHRYSIKHHTTDTQTGPRAEDSIQPLNRMDTCDIKRLRLVITTNHFNNNPYICSVFQNYMSEIVNSWLSALRSEVIILNLCHIKMKSSPWSANCFPVRITCA